MVEMNGWSGWLVNTKGTCTNELFILYFKKYTLYGFMRRHTVCMCICAFVCMYTVYVVSIDLLDVIIQHAKSKYVDIYKIYIY